MKTISFEERLAKILKKKKKTLSLAESCTGGLIASRITDLSGSSDYFLGGVTAYSDNVKMSVLDVPRNIIKKNGAVSREVAKAMAEGAKARTSSDFSASVTGVAGPSGGTGRKPVGLAFIAFSDGKKTRTKKLQYKGDRGALKKKFSDAVLKLILDNM
ncbi:MAG: CinA family protein [Candidatus Tantalella remota]|nr:CinA family protein [Candidatus Tantalella remota]